jgi:hypothetical protein
LDEFRPAAHGVRGHALGAQKDHGVALCEAAVDERIGRSEVDPHVIGEKPKEPVGHLMNKIYRFGQKKLKVYEAGEFK